MSTKRQQLTPEARAYVRGLRAAARIAEYADAYWRIGAKSKVSNLADEATHMAMSARHVATLIRAAARDAERLARAGRGQR